MYKSECLELSQIPAMGVGVEEVASTKFSEKIF